MPRAVLSVYSEIPERVGLRFSYNPEVNERLKDHGGLWDPDRRTWHVSRRSIEAVTEILVSEFDMQVVDDTGYGNGKASRSDAVVVDRVAFYEALFRRLSESDAKAKHRDLMRAFHPDSYGDPEEAKAINAAWDHVQGRNRRGA